MLIDTYKEFSLADQVAVKQDAIYGFISSIGPSFASDQLPIFTYVMRNRNLLTIVEIDYDPHSLVQAYFSFLECDGSLYYGQFSKYYPAFYILNPIDF